MASEKAFALVAGVLSCPFGGGVPGLDVQLDALDFGQGPGKGRDRSKCLTRQATPAVPGRDGVARGGAALLDGSEPESCPSNGFIGRGECDAEGVPGPGDQPVMLALDVAQRSGAVRVCGQGADQRKLGVCGEVEQHRHIPVAESSKPHLAIAREGARHAQGKLHASSIQHS